MKNFRKPYRLKKKKSILKSRFFWLTILILIIFGGIFYLIFFYPLFQIKEIEISGNQKIFKENLENFLKEKINQNFLFFSSTKSIFLINFSQIKKELFKNFPQIDEINLKRKFPNSIVLQINEKKPVAIFCKEECFFIDEEGIIFESTLIEPNFFILKKEIKGEIILGQEVIKKEQISKILEIDSKLKNELKILTKEILVVSEERFNVKNLENWQIYFNFKENLDWQLTKLRTVLEKEIPHEKRKNLEYIDLRFGNFAPYKYK